MLAQPNTRDNCGSEQFRLELKNLLDSLETTGDVDEVTNNILKTVCTLGQRHFPPMKRVKSSKLSPETFYLMRLRCEAPPPADVALPVYQYKVLSTLLFYANGDYQRVIANHLSQEAVSRYKYVEEVTEVLNNPNVVNSVHLTSSGRYGTGTSYFRWNRIFRAIMNLWR